MSRMNAELSNPPASGLTVTVGCRMPNGLVLVTRTSPYRYVLNGNKAHAHETPPWVITGNAGLTSGIPAEVWDDWYEENRDQSFVTNRVVFLQHDPRPRE